MSMRDLEPLPSSHSLTQKLKSKSRNRRESAKRLASPGAAPRPLRNDVLPTLAIVNLPIADLRPLARKIRKLDPAHVREVAATVSALGFCVPIIIGMNNVVIDGETRLEAAKQLGLGNVPCVRIEHLSDEEQRLLRLAVNRLGEKGQWNLDELRIEFDELILADAPIGDFGIRPR